VDLIPSSESEIAISDCCHLLLKELQAGQTQRWLIQAADTTVINKKKVMSLHKSSSNVRHDKEKQIRVKINTRTPG
jgi:hypothetical protein